MRYFAVFFTIQALLMIALLVLYAQPLLHAAHALNGTPTP